ncbi:MAG: PD-(D/E)XK nuclease family protein [Chloroflexota bacterium]
MSDSQSESTVRRVFLGWDAPALQRVRDFLIPDASEGPVDLRSTMVVVPTRHAGRRLREALAIICHDNSTYLLPPRIVTPPSLVAARDTDAARQSLDVSTVWTHLVLDIDPANYHGLFPKPPTRTFAWALSTGQLLQALRRELLEHGYTIRNVLDLHGDRLEERQRWEDMARLEDLYVERYLEVTGEQEPGEASLQAASEPDVPDGIERVVIACVTDPAPLALSTLIRLSQTIGTTVLVHAPEEYEHTFDTWGQPKTDNWRTETIDIPDIDNSLILASSSATESPYVVRHIQERGVDIAVGVLDPEVGPYLEADIEEAGFAVFDPNGVSVSTTPLLHLLCAYRDFVSDGSYRSLATMLRNADVLDYLAASEGLPANRLLKELDTFQNHYLPTTVADIRRRFRDGALTDELPAERLTTLRRAVQALAALSFGSSREPIETRIRQFLQTVFTHRELHYGTPDDDAFRGTAELIDEALQASTASTLRTLGFSDTEILDMLLDQLGGARFVPQRSRDSIDLEGWLELQWNDAAHVVVTGMNEGRAPARLGNETFLPESLRAAIGIRTNADRYGRDVYLTRSLIESRRTNGRVMLIAAKTTANGDPLLPSRILFRCSDSELPERASRLFGPSADKRASVPSTISFKFKADAPLEGAPPPVTRVSVVGLRDYLACPFRFYLKHVLRMEALDDRKRELDALDFGSLIHHVMNTMASDASMKDCDDAAVLTKYLVARADEWVADRLGPSLPVNISIQLSEARERLAAAARAQARTVSEGWRIIGYEESFEHTINGLVVRGRIDRIDRHIERGETRVLDYKASENGKTPEQAHFGTWRETALPYTRFTGESRPKRWTDLQLPLYALMLPERLRGEGPVTAGYFNLPADPGSTGIVMWKDFGESLTSTAYECAAAAAHDILGGIFWPPAEKVDYDDFEAIFPGGVNETTIEPGRLGTRDTEDAGCR